MAADFPGQTCHKFPRCSAGSLYSRFAGAIQLVLHLCSLRMLVVDVVGIFGTHTRSLVCPARLSGTFLMSFLTLLTIWGGAFRFAASMVLRNEASTVWLELRIRVVLEHTPVQLVRMRDDSCGLEAERFLPATAQTESLHRARLHMAQWLQSAATALAEAIGVRMCKFPELVCNNQSN